jgi:hypothetical protein
MSICWTLPYALMRRRSTSDLHEGRPEAQITWGLVQLPCDLICRLPEVSRFICSHYSQSIAIVKCMTTGHLKCPWR